MNVSRLRQSCLWCQRPYRGISRLVWCFNQELELELVGAVHTSHASLWRGEMGVPVCHAIFDGDPETARRHAWAKNEVYPQEYYFGLLTLFSEPPDRERHLAYWRQSGYVKDEDVKRLRSPFKC